MKKIIIVICFLFLFSFSVSAETNEYENIYEYSHAYDIENSLDESVKSFFDDSGINIDDSDWINKLNTESVFSHIWKVFKSGAKAPIKAGLSVLAITLIAAAFKIYGDGNAADIAVKFAVTLSVFSVLSVSISGSIGAAVDMMKGCSSFMLSFVPVYMGIVSISGAPAHAASSSAMLLFSAEFISSAVAFLQSAVLGAYLALSISSSVSPIMNKSGLAEAFKKTGIWVMSLCSTVFLGLLGAKSAVNSAADGVAVRTAKYILGTCVPVAGQALSGAVNTVSASLSVIKTSVGIYGIVALVLMLLPVLFELLIWRLVLLLTGGICSLFSVDETSKLLKALDGVLALLIGAVLTVGATFIISLSVVIGAGRGI